MKKVRVITRQIVHQEWEYEVEVEDDFDPTFRCSPTQARYVLNKIQGEGLQGRHLDNDEVHREFVVQYDPI